MTTGTKIIICDFCRIGFVTKILNFARKFQNATTRIWLKYAKGRFAIYSRNLEFAVEAYSATVAIYTIAFFLFFLAVAPANALTNIPVVTCADWDKGMNWYDTSKEKLILSKEDLDIAKKNKTAELRMDPEKKLFHACLNGTEMTKDTIGQASEGSLTPKNARSQAVRLMQYFLSFLGIITAVMIVYGGVLWITSQGSDDKIAKSRKIIIASAIGLLLVTVAWVIVSFVVSTAGKAFI